MPDADYVIARLADIFQKFPALLSPEKMKGPAGRGILFRSLIAEIKQTVGDAVFNDAWDRVSGGDVVVACGLTNAELFGPLTCGRCGSLRCSRLYCCTCGCVFSIKNELGRRSLERSQTLLADWTRALKENSSLLSGAMAAVDLSLSDGDEEHDEAGKRPSSSSCSCSPDLGLAVMSQRELNPARNALNAAALAGMVPCCSMAQRRRLLS